MSVPPPGVTVPPPGIPPQAAPAAYTQEQIDQLLAPIALYPDPLVGEILMAATYPLEVVEAERWLQSGQNASLPPDQLQAALASETWDPSVKSLVALPQVLAMMDQNIQWTEQLGDAFLANQPAVMDSVQRLRSMAQASGNLSSSAQETVAAQDGAITIEPPASGQVYVPYYNPAAVYGAWPYADYPPDYFPPPPGIVAYNDGLIGFSTGIVVVGGLWGWDHWDWHHHRLDIDDHQWAALSPNRPEPAQGVWMHDPGHRHGVPYRSMTTQMRFDPVAIQSNFRGYATPQPSAAAQFMPAERPLGAHETRTPAPTPAATPAMHAPHTMPMQRAAPQSQQRMPPVFESFSRGPEVRAQSARGAASRASMPSAPHGGGNPAPRGGGTGHTNDTRR